MIPEHVRTALASATYEWIPRDGCFYGEIATLPGVRATAETLELCRVQLAEVLTGWLEVQNSP